MYRESNLTFAQLIEAELVAAKALANYGWPTGSKQFISKINEALALIPTVEANVTVPFGMNAGTGVEATAQQ